MTEDEFKNLQRGDLVRHETRCEVYQVTANYGNRVTAVRTIDMTNPSEWRLVAKVRWDEKPTR